jgi:large subunit ribosomal protein L25
MEVGKLTVTRRTTTGKGAAHKLRASGLVPGVCYGASASGPIAPLPIVVDVKALRAALDPVRKQNTVITLTVQEEGKAPQELSALLREYQLDIIRREVTHVDLLAIDPSKEVNAEVPLEFTGKHIGAIDGATLHIVMRSLSVRAKPQDIPVKIVVDVSPLVIGDVIHVSDLALPAGVTSSTGLEQAVITCNPPEKDVAPAEGAAAAAAPGAEGAAAAPAAGGKAPAGKAAPAAGGKAPAGGKAAPAAAAAKPAAAPKKK